MSPNNPARTVGLISFWRCGQQASYWVGQFDGPGDRAITTAPRPSAEFAQFGAARRLKEPCRSNRHGTVLQPWRMPDRGFFLSAAARRAVAPEKLCPPPRPWQRYSRPD